MTARGDQASPYLLALRLYVVHQDLDTLAQRRGVAAAAGVGREGKGDGRRELRRGNRHNHSKQTPPRRCYSAYLAQLSVNPSTCLSASASWPAMTARDSALPPVNQKGARGRRWGLCGARDERVRAVNLSQINCAVHNNYAYPRLAVRRPSGEAGFLLRHGHECKAARYRPSAGARHHHLCLIKTRWLAWNLPMPTFKAEQRVGPFAQRGPTRVVQFTKCRKTLRRGDIQQSTGFILTIRFHFCLRSYSTRQSLAPATGIHEESATKQARSAVPRRPGRWRGWER